MAFDATPTELWPSYTFDVGSDDTLHIPRAALPGLSAEDANATTGDLRAILLAISASAWAYYKALASADRSLACVVKQPQAYAVTSGSFAEYTRMTFSIEYYVGFDAPAVVAEPA